VVPALLTPSWPSILKHTTIGASTGFMVEDRGDWPKLMREAAELSTVAVELAALSGPELPPLVDYLLGNPSLPFVFISAHAPTKEPERSERAVVELLQSIVSMVDAIVVHPDVLEDLPVYRPLGRKLVIENMDDRKPTGRTADELAPYFEALPEAGLCLDVAHAKSIDPAMQVGSEILSRFGSRLRHVHISSLDHDSHHVPLTGEDEKTFAPLLGRCRDVPWILEAPPR
jgi:hypothetical protein